MAPKAMRRLIREFGNGKDPPFKLHHDGIEDYFIEKASVVDYLHSGRWVELAGSD